jgi:transcriptional regulator with XRE-family HTH domain
MRIQRIRVQRGMTQAQLAEKAGVSRGYVAQIESPATARHHRTPSRRTLEKLAKALGINVGELVK